MQFSAVAFHVIQFPGLVTLADQFEIIQPDSTIPFVFPKRWAAGESTLDCSMIGQKIEASSSPHLKEVGRSYCPHYLYVR